MTAWNYRLVRYRDGSGYGLHEVHYDACGKPWGMTEEAVGFTADPEEGPIVLRESLAIALIDARKPVFDEPETWPGTAPSGGGN